MPSEDSSFGEFVGKNSDQKKALRAYKAALEESRAFVQPEFEKAIRMHRLFSGELPAELEGTFSKVMLWFPFSIVDQELPHTAKVLTSPRWFDVKANEPFLEQHSDVVQKWLHYQMDQRQRIARTIVPTLQSEHITGTGYRFYGHKFLTKKHQKRTHDRVMGMPTNFRNEEIEVANGIISGQHMDFFNVFPAPGGGTVNDFDQTGENAVDYLIVFTYPTREDVKAQMDRGVFDKKQTQEMLDNGRSEGSDPTIEWKQQISTQKNGWGNLGSPSWMNSSRHKDVDLSKRNRLGWLFQRDKWRIIGEDKYVLYDGPPLIDAFPLAKFVGSYNLANWFGTGLIEPVEDLIISMIMNFNHRLDYLAGTLHPPAFVPSQLLEDLGGDKSIFDPEPYSVLEYDHTAYNQPISTAVWRDRFPEIAQQAFFEEGKMQEFVEEILGQPNLGKGIASGQNTGDLGATGVVSLIDQGAARQMMRAVNTEQSGLLESLRLTMMFGEKFKTSDTQIRIKSEDGGVPWEKVPHEAIVNGYGIELIGTRSMNQAQETFKRMLSVAPHLLNNPNVANQTELLRQLMEPAGFEKVDDILGDQRGVNPISLSQGSDVQDQPGGAATSQNDFRSMANRSTVQPGTGAPVAAGNAVV